MIMTHEKKNRHNVSELHQENRWNRRDVIKPAGLGVKCSQVFALRQGNSPITNCFPMVCPIEGTEPFKKNEPERTKHRRQNRTGSRTWQQIMATKWKPKTPFLNSDRLQRRSFKVEPAAVSSATNSQTSWFRISDTKKSLLIEIRTLWPTLPHAVFPYFLSSTTKKGSEQLKS